jgi:hypothetical protein
MALGRIRFAFCSTYKCTGGGGAAKMRARDAFLNRPRRRLQPNEPLFLKPWQPE